MSHDEAKPQLRPIPGPPADAPNPPTPHIEPKPQPTPKEPAPQRMHGSDSIPGPNEIADRLEELMERGRYADKLGLETCCEIGKLLVLMADVHKYQGKQYERINPRFQYPHWRKMVPRKPRDDEPISDDEAEFSEDDDVFDESDPVVELQWERDSLDAQVKAATQQYRNERVKREEVEEQYAGERRKLEATSR